MQVSVLNKSSLHQRLLRLDAEYYKPSILKLENNLRNKPGIKIKSLGDICYVTDGEHGTIKTTREGYSKYFGARNVLWGFLDNTNVEYINEKDHFRNSRSILKPTDVLISCVGNNIGYAAFVPNDIGVANIVRNVALIRSKSDKINNYYLLAYFLSEYGKKLFIRTATGNAQPLVSLDNIKEIPIPIVSKRFQETIENLVQKSEELILKSNEFFEKAISIFLKAAGFLDWELKNKKTFIKQFSTTTEEERIDAEFFQPKYDEIIKKLKSQKHSYLDEHFNMISGKNFPYYEDGEVGVIKTKQVLNNFINFEVESKTNNETLVSNKLTRLKDRDVVFASMGVGSLGKTSIYYMFENTGFEMTIDSTIKIFREKDISSIYPEVLCVYFNSYIGQELIYKYVVGTSGIISIYNKYLEKFPIPLLEIDIQNEIASLVQSSHQFKLLSKSLLNIAKTSIEKVITKNEDDSIEWIYEQINKMGLEIK